MSNGLPGCWAAGFRGVFPAAPRWQPGSGAGPAHVWVRAPLPSPQGCSPWAVAGLLLWAFCAFPSCGALRVLLWARRPGGAVCWADCWGCGVGLGVHSGTLSSPWARQARFTLHGGTLHCCWVSLWWLCRPCCALCTYTRLTPLPPSIARACTLGGAVLCGVSLRRHGARDGVPRLSTVLCSSLEGSVTSVAIRGRTKAFLNPRLAV